MPESPENLNPVPPAPTSKRPTSRGASTRNRRTAGRRPLPDAHAISTFSIPDPAPPYDGAGPAGARVSAIEPPRAGNGAAFPCPASTAGSASIAGTWPSQFAQVLSETLVGSRPTSQLVPWTTEQARKRISQLGPMLASRWVPGVPGAPGIPAGRSPGPAAARQPRVRRVIVTSPAQGVLEMTVIVDIGARSRAVAVRLERASTNAAASPKSALPTRPATRPSAASWLCTAVEAA